MVDNALHLELIGFVFDPRRGVLGQDTISLPHTFSMMIDILHCVLSLAIDSRGKVISYL